ncbi:AzlC family ABC transporter permease [Algicella marina]|uniref:Branched-chain amino acid ABC transporter permease n=1 Tax=Algicella marina TaxID=2683284 RepID=A0A6P1T5F6_9RHOB|nr:AzlC family ABC transporter permease [Algicella marina]QHQ36995.1 branched-chain amino acid ABC transporter permease [Algicella marina]
MRSASASPFSAFISGYLAGVPFVLVVIPFSLLFGVVATEAGLDIVQTMSMSFLVIAGASQFTALALLKDQAPLLIILATSLAVNMRMAMYSAALVPHIGAAPMWQRALAAYLLVDQSYGVSVQKYERSPEMTVPQKMAYYFGAVMAVCPLWYIFTFVGAVAGTAIPPEYALDFAVPITFLALVAPSLRTVPHIAAAVVSVTAALVFAGVPYSLGLIIAAVLAMFTGALVEIWLEKRV